MRSRMPATARWCGATSAARSSRSTSCTARASKAGWVLSRCAPEWQGSGLGKEIVQRGHRLARARRRDGDRPRDDAAHDGQHRLLLRARLPPGAPDDHAHARRRGRATRPAQLLGRLCLRDRDDALAECRTLVERLVAGLRLHARDRAHATTLVARRHACSCTTADASSGSRSATRRRWWRGARARSCACSSSSLADESRDSTRCCARCATSRGGAARGASRSACRANISDAYRATRRAGRARAMDRSADDARRVRGAPTRSAGSCCRTGRSERAELAPAPDSFQGVVTPAFRPRRRLAPGWLAPSSDARTGPNLPPALPRRADFAREPSRRPRGNVWQANASIVGEARRASPVAHARVSALAERRTGGIENQTDSG